MKRLVMVTVVLWCVSFVYSMNFNVGLGIGGNLAFLSTDGTYDMLLSERSPRLGLSVGVYCEYEFMIKENALRLSVQPGVFYSMKGFRVDDLQVNLDYLEIPVLLKARLALDQSIEPYVLTGPVLSLNMVRESQIGSYSVSSDDKRMDMGLIFGVGADFNANLSFDIRANFGLVNVIESDVRNQNHSVALLASYDFM